MRYEVIVTNQQPTCGGQAPVRSEIRYVETDDPVEYVKMDQPDASDLRVYKPSDDQTIVEYTSGSGMFVKYDFTED